MKIEIRFPDSGCASLAWSEVRNILGTLNAKPWQEYAPQRVLFAGCFINTIMRSGWVELYVLQSSDDVTRWDSRDWSSFAACLEPPLTGIAEPVE